MRGRIRAKVGCASLAFVLGLCLSLEIRTPSQIAQVASLAIPGAHARRGFRGGGFDRNDRNDKNDRNDRNDRNDARQNDDGGSRQNDSTRPADGPANRNADTPSGSNNNSNNAGSNNNNDDDNRNKADPNRPRTYGRPDNPSDRNARPPATLEEGFKRWFKAGGQDPSDKNDQKRGPSAPRDAVAPIPSKSATPAAASPSPPTPPGARVAPGTPLTPSGKPIRREATLPPADYRGAIGEKSYSAGEVLGVGLSQSGAHTAAGLGFKIGERSNDLTRLIVPEGVDAVDAREILKRVMPEEKFALNRLYRVYRAANQIPDGGAQNISPASDAVAACQGDRCQGRQMIGWQGDDLAECSKDLRVGVIDTDVDVDHPALDKIHISHVLPPKRVPGPTWHGTGIVALLAGNQRSGTPGLIPHAKLYLASAFFMDHKGEFAADTASLKNALMLMDRMEVKIVNMSFAGPRDEVIEPVINELSAKGMVFVAAAGNEGPNAPPSYPAAYKPVIAVTAVNPDRRVYAFANRGGHIDMAAPGVHIWTAVPGSREGYYTGTSYAAPFVTAIMATIHRGTKAKRKHQILEQINYDDLGAKGPDPVYGRGLAKAPTGCSPDLPIALSRMPAPPVMTGSIVPDTWVQKIIRFSDPKPAATPAGLR